jgi:RNA polymerase sigma-54 factor
MQSISLLQEKQVSLQQSQHLLINLAMKQAFHVLQLPLLELSQWLQMEIESNPILEMDIPDQNLDTLVEPEKDHHALRNKSQEEIEKRRKEHQENLLATPISLYEHLMKQVPLARIDPENVPIAELIIGHLNDKGYLETPLREIAPSVPLETVQKILNEIQSFDPPGIGARNLQECLLLQLKLKKKETHLSFKILSKHYDDLIYNRIPLISQKLRVPIPELMHIIEKEITPLDLHPGYRYCYQPITSIIPDLLLICIEGQWRVEVNTAFLPRIQIAPVYQQALQNSSLESKETFYLRRQLASGRWLKRIVQRRNETLRRIGELLIKKQVDFFNGEKAGLKPMTIQETAVELQLHESTITRAAANKFVACPQGLFALKSFFTSAVKMENGKTISKHYLRKILLRTIARENKYEPLSDEEITTHLRKLGISCARRTIAKYRETLKIAPAAKRKKWVGYIDKH